MSYTPTKTKMTIETQPFEDVSPIKNGDFPAIAMLVFRGVMTPAIHWNAKPQPVAVTTRSMTSQKGSRIPTQNPCHCHPGWGPSFTTFVFGREKTNEQ